MSPWTNLAFGTSLTFSILPLERLSYIVTFAPKSVSFLVRWKPMKPAPPVTSMFFPLSCFMKLKLTIKAISLFGPVNGICRS